MAMGEGTIKIVLTEWCKYEPEMILRWRWDLFTV